MRIILLATVLFATACGGALSDEQRKKMRERMKEDEIKHVTEGELMAAAVDYGRAIATVIQRRDPAMVNKALIDSLESAFEVKITAITPVDSMLLAIEQQLVEAYTSGAGQANIADDVQKMDRDSVLYTKPIMHERPDGTVEFTRALSIHMPTKSVILSIED
jgi:uncharacterized membrane protein